MITQELKKSDHHYGKVWCSTCPKTLETQNGEDYGAEALDQPAINFLLGIAELHEKHHPNHNLEVTIYERTPLQNA